MSASISPPGRWMLQFWPETPLDLLVQLDRVLLQLRATFGSPLRVCIPPAACQVEPAVSSRRSSSTTSVQPALVRWYSTLAPTTPATDDDDLGRRLHATPWCERIREPTRTPVDVRTRSGSRSAGRRPSGRPARGARRPWPGRSPRTSARSRYAASYTAQLLRSRHLHDTASPVGSSIGMTSTGRRPRRCVGRSRRTPGSSSAPDVPRTTVHSRPRQASGRVRSRPRQQTVPWRRLPRRGLVVETPGEVTDASTTNINVALHRSARGSSRPRDGWPLPELTHPAHHGLRDIDRPLRLGGTRTATGTPCFVIVIRSPFSTSSRRRGRWVLASYAPIASHRSTSLRLV